MRIPNIYEGNGYRKFLLIPLLMVFAALFFIPTVPLGIDFRGGLLFTVYTNSTQAQMAGQQADLSARLAKFSSDASVRQFENPSGRGFEIEMQADENLAAAQERLAGLQALDLDRTRRELEISGLESNGTIPVTAQQRDSLEAARKKELDEANAILAQAGSKLTVTSPSTAYAQTEAEFQSISSGFRDKVLFEIRAAVPVTEYSSKEIGAALSKFFFAKVVQVLILSFLFSSLVIVAVFRSGVPTLAVLFGAFADITVTLGVMGILQIPLSLASVAALLMLIGFSLDTDMMLTIRALKRTEDNVRTRVYESMKTGLTMNASAILAFSVLVAVSLALKVEVYYEIGAVAVIGSIVDFVATWLGNAATVLWYADSKGIK
jgi:preprotein translocase subunit SecF